MYVCIYNRLQSVYAHWEQLLWRLHSSCKFAMAPANTLYQISWLIFTIDCRAYMHIGSNYYGDCPHPANSRWLLKIHYIILIYICIYIFTIDYRAYMHIGSNYYSDCPHLANSRWPLQIHYIILFYICTIDYVAYVCIRSNYDSFDAIRCTNLT